MHLFDYRGFPQHYAAASLKLPSIISNRNNCIMFSAALRCGLIEARVLSLDGAQATKFSAALRCGLIEAQHPERRLPPISLFSAALRCGLIEAEGTIILSPRLPGFPQHYAAASLKLAGYSGYPITIAVFRSITLRPH